MEIGLNCYVMRDFMAHFANPVRLKILCRLAGGSACVTELVEATKEKQSTVSQQLKNLLLAGFIAKQREGSRVYYRIAHPAVRKTMEFLQGLSAELPQFKTRSVFEAKES
ncbi:MAG TPA: transcriptional regulator [Planctomycetes bacterium]|nr:transcriptional regulator [Planctomycetota bacterium]